MTLPDNVIIYILIAGVAATAIWRFAGVLLSSGLSEEGLLISWVRAVSMALIAGLIARIVVFPPGALEDIGLFVRIGAFGFGVLIFFLARRHMLLGILAGMSALIGAHLLSH